MSGILPYWQANTTMVGISSMSTADLFQGIPLEIFGSEIISSHVGISPLILVVQGLLNLLHDDCNNMYPFCGLWFGLSLGQQQYQGSNRSNMAESKKCWII